MMFKWFKKVLTISIILVESLCVVQAINATEWIYEIQTSAGEKTLVLPEGMSFEEAYIEMAKLYIEERADHEKLIEQTAELVAKSKEFEEVSAKLKTLQDELVQKNEEISNLYRRLNRVHPVYFLTTAGISTDTFAKVSSIDLGFGLELFESLVAIVEVSYPWCFGFKAGVKF